MGDTHDRDSRYDPPVQSRSEEIYQRNEEAVRDERESRTFAGTGDRPLAERSRDVYAMNDADTRLGETRARFGGIDLPATLIGGLVIVAMTAIFGGLAGAVFGVQVFGDGSSTTNDFLVSAAVGAAVLCVSYFVGGWATGRIARYNGAKNGVFAALWTLLLAFATAGAVVTWGERFDVLAGVGIPNFLTGSDAMAGGLVAAVVGVILMVLFAALGGARGEAYHSTADNYLTEPHVHGV